MAVLDLEGRVELATASAEHYFGLRPGFLATELGYEWLPPLLDKTLKQNRVIEREREQEYIQQFLDQREYFFQPVAIPIPLGSECLEPTSDLNSQGCQSNS